MQINLVRHMERIIIQKAGEENWKKIEALKNPKLTEFVARYIEHCNPDSVFVCDDSDLDIEYVRERAIERGEENKLAIKGHTIHFDGYHDQGRDKENTKFLLPEGVDLGENINSIDRTKGLSEINEILKDNMKGHEMYVMFLCLGPTDSEFSIPAVQLTDSAYVAHSLTMLYRKGYDQFKRINGSPEFFRFVHSQGELENSVSKNIHKRRVYIDLEDDIVFSANTQYAGNTVGLKKLAMRLAIQKAGREGWLCEHMFVMGVKGPSGRVTYFAGAYPSACGKTSTAMVPGETIIGDDIAYFREINGVARAVNVENGIFGIIRDVNEKDDPVIWKVLTTEGEVIFSNILRDEAGNVYWLGDGREPPERGINFSGEWWHGKTDEDEKAITLSHKNARFTVRMEALDNLDPMANSPEGVEIGGIIYGGRDSDTSVPVEESFNWEHGIIAKGATLESETTAATLGKEGVRKFNLMSNLDFLSVTLGKYIQMNLDFGKKLKKPPSIFGVNYFLKDEEGNYLNDKKDKKVWLKWMERRVHGEVGAIKTPTGFIPKYEDLKRLFKEVLNKEYTKEDYDKQFEIRVLEKLAKIDRIEVIYKQKVPDAPDELYRILNEERTRLEEAKEKYGEYIKPEAFL